MCDDPTPQQISSVKRSRKADWLPPQPRTDLLSYMDLNKKFLEIMLLHGKFETVDRLGSK